MASFAKARDELLVAHDEGTTDDEEFALLWEQNVSKNPSFPYKDYEEFHLKTLDPVECKAEFRFEKNDLPFVAEALQIPDTFFCQQRSMCDGMEGLCIALKRFYYPCRYSDMIPRFAKPECASALHDSKHNSGFYLQYAWPSHHAMEQLFAKATKAGAVCSCGCREGAVLDNCYEFIDGIVRPICRPQDNQRVVYNGHKRVHAIKFQSLTVQYGMIAQTYGPVGKCQSC